MPSNANQKCLNFIYSWEFVLEGLLEEGLGFCRDFMISALDAGKTFWLHLAFEITGHFDYNSLLMFIYVSSLRKYWSYKTKNLLDFAAWPNLPASRRMHTTSSHRRELLNCVIDWYSLSRLAPNMTQSQKALCIFQKYYFNAYNIKIQKETKKCQKIKLS